MHDVEQRPSGRRQGAPLAVELRQDIIRPDFPPRPPDRAALACFATAGAGLLALAATCLVAAAPLDAQADSLRVAGDVSLHYELSGAGPPMVVIHGWTHDARVWELQTPG